MDVVGTGEDALIEAIRLVLSGGAPGVRLGPGDDAALVEPGRHLDVLTVDMLVEDVDFVRPGITPRDLGYRAIAVNVSDVAAMGGSPRYALVALGIPDDVDTAWAVELASGMREAAEEFALAIVGGDISRAGQVVVSVSLTGEVPASGAVPRSGAQPGDRIVVTGAFGAAAGALRLQRAPARSVKRTVGAPWVRELVAALERPTPRVGEGRTLARAGATAMIDVSDGLTLDLARLCRASGVGGAVVLSHVPVAGALRELERVLPVEPLQLALEGGEDFELLATLPAEVVKEAAAEIEERYGTPLTDIGEIREGGSLVARRADGTERPLEPRGWDHLAR
jgi:thiamine-monophosphate kinase